MKMKVTANSTLLFSSNFSFFYHLVWNDIDLKKFRKYRILLINENVKTVQNPFLCVDVVFDISIEWHSKFFTSFLQKYMISLSFEISILWDSAVLNVYSNRLICFSSSNFTNLWWWEIAANRHTHSHFIQY